MRCFIPKSIMACSEVVSSSWYRKWNECKTEHEPLLAYTGVMWWLKREVFFANPLCFVRKGFPWPIFLFSFRCAMDSAWIVTCGQLDAFLSDPVVSEKMIFNWPESVCKPKYRTIWQNKKCWWFLWCSGNKEGLWDPPCSLQGGPWITHLLCGRPCSAAFSAFCKWKTET